VGRQIERPTRGSAASRSPRCSLGGGEIRQSWCGPASARARRTARGERADHVVQPELAEPHGLGGEGLSREPRDRRPSSALAGYMAPPDELGLRWDPDCSGF
jgi:hypothetical protein